MVNLLSHLADLEQVFQPAIGKASRLHQERKAGRSLLEPEDLFASNAFDATLSRLIGGESEKTWWQSLFATVGGAYTTPIFLSEPSVERWLEEPQVKEDLKKLAWSALTATDASEVRQRLRGKFADITQEAEYLADALIQLIQSILLAGYLAEMSPGERASLASLRKAHASLATVQQGVDGLLERVAQDPLVTKIHDDQTLQELYHIQSRRAFSQTEARAEIQQLAQRIETGDLRHATDLTKAQVLHWAVRLLVNQPGTLNQAQAFRDRLSQLNPLADARIPDALLLEAHGDSDGALRILRDSEDPDTRSVFFMLLFRLRGKAAALEWWNAQDNRYEADFLTGIGRSAVATTLMEEGHWKEAAEYLAATHKQHAEWPDLYFLEGAAHTALLLPPSVRQFALEMNLFHAGMHPVEGPEADRLRERATENFQRAEQVLTSIDPRRARGTRYWLLWLRLTNPNPAVRQVLREELQEQLSIPKEAVELLHVALNFDIPFNEGQIWRYLEQRSKLGGLEGNELIARFLLAEKRMNPSNLLAFLDEEENELRSVLASGPILLARIEALAQDGQTARARELLEDNREEFDQADHQRIGIMIINAEGKDPRPELEARYQSTHDLLDLNNLASYLGHVKDWPALRPLLEELFAQQRTLQTAVRLAYCMGQDPNTNQADVLMFLSTNQDLVDREPDLQSTKAWALFETGNPEEAKEIINHLRSARNADSDLHLEINLELQTGAWEKFPGIVEREWPRREEHSPAILLRIADLAAAVDVTSDRAFELTKLAVDKGREDPTILTKSIELVHRLGREGEYLREWFSRAIALSSEEGPIITFSTSELVENWLPAHQEQTRSINEQLLQGEVPLHFAAKSLNIPLSMLLLGIPGANYRNLDARGRTIIPISSGARAPVEIQQDWTIGLDATSLLVLSYLGLLRKAIENFRQVALAPDTMVLLLNERSQSKFHQPSRVKAAEKIRDLIDSGRLRTMESLPSPPAWLIEEVGAHLAQQLRSASDHRGIVVSPKPIYKLQSHMTAEAQLQEYGALVISTIALEELLFRRGAIDQDRHEKASQYLASQDRTDGEEPDLLNVAGPIFLDNLAITYLQSADLLDALVSCGLELRVHPSLKQEQNNLILRHREGERLAQETDAVRTILRDAIQQGKISFLPRHRPNDDERRAENLVPILTQYCQDCRPCDAICIDDRFTNRHAILTDRQGRAVPMICTLDVLRYLETQGKLSLNDRLASLHKLRQSGFALIPAEIEELEYRLKSVQWKDDGTFQESAELRTLRQMLAKIRSLNMLNLPPEATLLVRHRLAASLLIRRAWEDENTTIEQAVYKTDWLWRHVAPSPLDWIKNNGTNEHAIEALTYHMTLLFQPMPTLRTERRQALQAWLEGGVLAPLLPANFVIVDRLAIIVRQQIEEWSTRIATDIEDKSD